MSREILFRAKNINGVSRYGFLSAKNEIRVFYEMVGLDIPDDAENEFIEYEIIPETISQFTGAYDSNVNMIYENDVVKIENQRLCKAVWDKIDCGYHLTDANDCIKTSFLNIAGLNYKVVGQNYSCKTDEKGDWVLE